MVEIRTHKEIKGFLMHPKSRGVRESYYLIKADHQVIFVVSPGQNGSEYNKTEGSLSNYEGVQTYRSLYGQGLMLMQRNDEQGEAKEFKVVTLNLGKQIVVPVGWMMCLINISKSVLVVLGNVDIESKEVDSKPILEKHGLAYYVIEKKGEVSFEQNPNYSVHPQIATE